VSKAWEEVSASFDRFCLAAGTETLGAMMEAHADLRASVAAPILISFSFKLVSDHGAN
jgi:hypothetical protein